MIDECFYKALGPVPLGELIAGLDIEPLDTKYLDEVINGVAPLETSQAGQVSFLSAKKNRDRLSTAKATACFIPENIASLAGDECIIPLISKTPRSHFGRVTSRLVQEIRLFDEEDADKASFLNCRIHPTAIIASSVKLSENVEIGPYAVIGPGVTIRSGTRIGAHVTLECTHVGRDCFIKPHAAIGTRGFGVDGDEKGIFDLPHIGRVMIGDRVSVGCHTAIDRGLLGDTVISDDVKIDNLVQIAHNVRIGERSMLAGHVGLSGSCHIGQDVLMGGSAGLADHITVGDGARLAAYAGVMKDIPAGEVWSGIPAMPLRDHMRSIAATKKLTQKT